MASVRKSLVISFADKYSVMMIQFVSTLILARLLTPEEIGIFSLGAVIIGFAQMLRDFGVSTYLVQERDLTRSRIRTAFGVTLVIAWLAALSLLSVSSLIADFYDEPNVETVISILCISLFFIPFNSTVLGLLRRNMQFHILMLINLSSTVVHAVVATLLAFIGLGFESLAWASVASAATTLIIGIIKRPEDAQFIPSFSEFRRIFTFGSLSSGATLISETGEASADLSIGKNISFDALGIYSRATGVVNLFKYAVTAAIQPIILPAFAKNARNNEPIKTPYLQGITYYTALAWPFYSFVGLLPLEIIDVLYGAQWTEAAPIVTILCYALVLQALVVFASPALIAAGKIDVVIKIQLLIQPPRILLTIAASFQGLIYIAAVQIIYYIVCFFIFNFHIRNSFSITNKEIILASTKSAAVTLISIFPTAIVYNILQHYSSFSKLGLCSLTWAVSFILALFITKHPALYEVLTLKKQLTKITG